MSRPTVETRCPDGTTVTEFLERRLDREAREKLMMHFATCPECRELVLEGSSLPTARSTVTQRWLGTSTALGAALAILMTYGPATWGGRASRTAFADVIAASASLRYRPSLARLSEDFPAREPKPVERGSRQGAPTEFNSRLWSIADHLRMDAEEVPALSTLHALGVSYLLLGETDRAVRTLEEAVLHDAGARTPIVFAIRRSRNSELLNDLAAAYQAALEHHGQVTVKPFALEAAQQAWALAKTPAIAWTRAVVIESFDVREQSIAAWRAFLDVESSGPGSDEARQRLSALERPTGSEAWDAIRDRLPGLATGELDAAVRHHRQEVRLWCEDELLPQWGRAVLEADPSATRRLEEVARIAAALVRAGGDAKVAATVEAIRKASPAAVLRLAKGHVAFGVGRDAQEASEPVRALREMETAVDTLIPDLTPFAWRARVERAAALYLSNEYGAARTALLRLPMGDGTLSDSCEGKAGALLGIIALQTGSYEEAAAHYGAAVSAFRRAGETGFEAQLVSRLAAALELAGETEKARTNRDLAFRILDRTGERKPRHDAMIEAAYVAIGNEHDAVADLYLDTLISMHAAARDNARTCSALMWRSAYRYRRGRTALAIEDLATARHACASISDRAIRERSLANLRLAEASIAVAGGAAIHGAGLSEAIDYFRRTSSHVWLRTAYFTRARLLERSDPSAAERDFRAAIEEGERSRDKFDTRASRISFTATADEIVDGYVEFLLARQRTEDAFEAADRNRVRELVDSPTARWPGSDEALVPRIRASLPLGAVLVEYRVLRESIVVWVVTEQTFVAETLPVSLETLAPSIDALTDEAPRAVLIDHGARLFDALVRRIESRIERATTVVLVPDDELERVPWCALYDRVQRRWVMERQATAVAPAASLFVEGANRLRERSGGEDRVVVITADAGGAGMPALPEATAEVEAIARMYPRTRILDGSTETAARVLQEARDATMLQFVGHTVVERDRSLRTLRLGPSEESRLGVAHIGALFPTKLRLVYLSACETDTGPILKSEGSATIARSFFAAGVPVIVGTLWPVRDEIARAASRTFHERLRSGDTPAESLRRAQLEVLARFGTEADWAAFRLLGAGV